MNPAPEVVVGHMYADEMAIAAGTNGALKFHDCSF